MSFCLSVQLLLILVCCDIKRLPNAFEITIPIQLRSDDLEIGGPRIVNFHYNTNNRYVSLEVTTLQFCREHNVMKTSCLELLKAAHKLLTENGEESADETLKSTIYKMDHIDRHNWAYGSERLNDFRSNVLGTEETSWLQEESAFDMQIVRHFIFSVSMERLLMATDRVPRVAFLHSLLVEHNTLILRELLDSVKKSGLMDSLTCFWLMNHGNSFNASEASELVQLYPKVKIVQRSDDGSRFELTTLRHLHRFVKNLKSSELYPVSIEGVTTGFGDYGDAVLQTKLESTQVFYLHTKGVSYKTDNANIRDWRNLMMHFLSNHHEQVFHLLRSELFDAVGVNYFTSPRHFSGNFWWASARYLQSLNEPNSTGKKGDAESWLLQSKAARVYSMHSSGINHYYNSYPTEMYDGSMTHEDEIALPCFG